MVTVQTPTRQYDLPWRQEHARRHRQECEVAASHCDGNTDPEVPRQIGRRKGRVPVLVAPSSGNCHPGARPVAGWGAEPRAGSSSGGISPAVLPAHATRGVAE
jgi:hypothetical protein